MAGPSEKKFRDGLCESRSYAVETTDPTGARTIDELRRQVKELRTIVEGDKVKLRQLVRDHERQLQQIREEEARRLDTSLEACSMRKEVEKANELKKLEERLKKQNELDLRQLAKEKAEELSKAHKKWHAEKTEAVRYAVETEKRLSLEEFQASFSEDKDDALAREDKLTREIFMLGEQNSSLEQQVKNLSRLNKAQIDQMRRIKQECDAKIDGILRKHKTEASREMAQLKLAEQIIAEKDHDLHAVGYRADMVAMEKEALEEEIANLKSSLNNTPVHEDGGTPSRRSMGGLLQKKVTELEAQIKKLDDEKAGLKQDNASLRKKLQFQDEEKLKALRKKNTELSTSVKELEDRMKLLRSENEQLQKTQQKSGSGSSLTGGDSDQNVRKALARQHAKDISEYTKQIHAKDRELTEIRKKVAKLEAAAATYSEPSPELEKKVKVMSVDKLRMERLIAKLYSRLPDVVNMEDFSCKDLEAADSSSSSASRVEQLSAENEALRGQVQALEEQATGGRAEPDGGPSRDSLLQENKELHGEVERLKTLSKSAAKLEAECVSLRESHDRLESANGSLEQRCHELSQNLKIANLALKELEGSNEASAELEMQLQELREEAEEKDRKISGLEEERKSAEAQLTGKQAIVDALQGQVERLEKRVDERDKTNQELRTALDSLQTQATPTSTSQTADISTSSRAHPQTTSTSPSTSITAIDENRQVPAPPTLNSATPGAPAEAHHSETGKRYSSGNRVRSPVKRGLRSMSPKTSSGELLDSSLDNEMRAVGVEFNDSFDSSEGVGFSDSNLDTSVLSDHSLPAAAAAGVVSSTPGRKDERDEGHSSSLASGDAHSSKLAHKVAWEGKEESDQAQAMSAPLNSAPTEAEGQGALSNLVEGYGGAGVQAEGEVEEEIGAESEQLSGGLDGEGMSHDRDSDGSHTPQSDSYRVGVYIAKYSYNPSEMSPNQNFDLELPLTAGDYLYVYGDMDDDGYYHGQLMSGESGMVPSNFIEKVMDDTDEDGSQPSRKSHKGHSSLLQDIEEVDEDVSSGGIQSIAPPTDLTLDKQFVEGGLYTLSIRWTCPEPLPLGTTGYCVYVNGDHNCDVSGPEVTSLLLTGIPRKQLVKISVRTATEEGESPDPVKLIILNPQYPEAPTNVKVQRSPTPPCLIVQWTPSKPLPEGNPIDGYAVSLNNNLSVRLGTSPKPVKSVCAQVFASDLRDFKDQLMKANVVSVTVCAVSGDYKSAPSLPIVVSKEDLEFVCNSGKMTADESEITSSATSLSSIEDDEEKEVYGQSAKAGGGGGVNGQSGDDGRGEGDEDKGGEMHSPSLEQEMEEVKSNGVGDDSSSGTQEEYTGPKKYYRALVRYDPQLQSPNEETADEELAFFENDILIGLQPVEEDGYVMAELNSKTGYIPSNLVEEITEEEELSRIDILLQEQRSRAAAGTEHTDSAHRPPWNMNGSQEGLGDGKHRMKALFDYDPAHDSPNENSEVELAITEGDVVTVFGKPDGDGFFKAELKGKRGLVPCNFLEEMTPPRNDGGSVEMPPPKNDGSVEVFAADEESMRIAEEILQRAKSPPRKTDSAPNQKRKGGSGFFSRGKSLLGRNRGGD